MTALKSKIEQAQEKLARAEANLRDLKEKQKARDKAQRQRQLAQNRKDDTRRKILLGSFCFSKMAENPEFKAQILNSLDKYLQADRDRALFDLPTRQITRADLPTYITPENGQQLPPRPKQ